MYKNKHEEETEYFEDINEVLKCMEYSCRCHSRSQLVCLLFVSVSFHRKSRFLLSEIMQMIQ